MFLSACGPPHAATASPGGPLSAGASGGEVIQAKPRDPNHGAATFAGFPLCTSGAPVELEKVTWHSTGHGHVTAMVRDIPIGALRDPHLEYLPLTARGVPEKVRPQLGGDFRRDLDKIVIRTPCDSPGDPATDPRRDLAIVIQNADSGITVDDFKIEYIAGGERYALDFDMELTLCGPGVDNKHC